MLNMVNIGKCNPHKQQFFTVLNTFPKSVSGSWNQNFLELLMKGNEWLSSPYQNNSADKNHKLEKKFKKQLDSTWEWQKASRNWNVVYTMKKEMAMNNFPFLWLLAWEKAPVGDMMGWLKLW